MHVLTASVRVTGLSPYSPSAPLPEEFSKPGKNETFDQLDARVWRLRIWANELGEVFHPAAYYKKCIDGAAALTKRKVKGAGNQTFAQQIRAGVMLLEDVPIFLPQTPEEILRKSPKMPILTKDVVGQRFYVSSTGDSRGGGKRVFKTYGMIPRWQAEFRLRIVNETITPEIIETYLQEGGMLQGIGRWSPRNGGNNGRFAVDSCEWSDQPL
jgi:hypothetical protein